MSHYLSPNISLLMVENVGMKNKLMYPLTVAAVLPSVPEGTVAGKSLPAHPAGSSVLTGVGLTEGKLGAAAYERQ